MRKALLAMAGATLCAAAMSGGSPTASAGVAGILPPPVNVVRQSSDVITVNHWGRYWCCDRGYYSSYYYPAPVYGYGYGYYPPAAYYYAPPAAYYYVPAPRYYPPVVYAPYDDYVVRRHHHVRYYDGW
jgi:hypothetical protein